ncbi:glycosyltransferase family 9 protein [Brachybacterium massiliense]|uniref:glycosyltransferase family 9 protein n=1 Tax=Brachybacterium massiliense TaxID=1755098 RepID=UPI000B3BB579|nr:glycosyltransferase family 9 protein [Brachybacterium massiliense]
MLDDRRLALIDTARLRMHRGAAETPVTLTELVEQHGGPLRVDVVRFDGIGDWILTFPLLSALAHDERIGTVRLVAPPAHRGLLARLRGIEVVSEEVWASHHTPWPHGGAGKVLAISALGQLRTRRAGRRRAGGTDLVVLPRWDTDRGQNCLAYAVGTGATIAGHDPMLQPQATRKEQRDRAAIALRAEDVRGHAHEAERLALLGETIGLRMPRDARAVRDLLGMPQHRSLAGFVALHTGAHDAFRRWPRERWAELIHLLLDRTALDVVLIGGPEDAAVHPPLVAIDPERVRSEAGRSPLRDLPDLLDGADLMIGCDSGPAHIAAALGVPTAVVSVFPEGDDPNHPNSPDRFGVRSAGGSVIIRPGRMEQSFAELDDARRTALIAAIPASTVLAGALDLIDAEEAPQ